MTSDRSGVKANGNDLSFVKVSIVDKKGITVPVADNLVNFSVKGAGFLAGVDNGDPTSHTSFKSNSVKALNALCLAVLQSNGSKGNITLSATSPGLQSATILINAK